jgi:glycosyltransferase involved in cell wall biosynthesis
MPGPTILQIIPRLDTGGAEMSTIEIAGALTRAGARALVASDGGRMAPMLAAEGGRLIHFPAATKNPARILGNARSLVRLCRAHDVSLIHARSRAPAWSGLVAARQARLPFVTTYHGAYNQKGAAKSLYNSVMARGDIVIANSEFTAGLICERHGVDPERIRVIHRGVDLAAFDPAAVPRERVEKLRLAWSITTRSRVILHAARMTRLKGHHVVVEALARLKAQDRLGDAIVVFAGDHRGREAYVRELEQLIEERKLWGHARIVGHCADVPAALASAHVALVASTEPEAFGRASAEAQAMGCPVIVTDLGALPETLIAADDATRTGWTVPPNDPDALADALSRAFDIGDAERAAMGARGRAHVRARFSHARMQSATLGVYDELLGGDLAARFLADENAGHARAFA